MRPSIGGFDGAPQRHVRERPDDGGGDGRQLLAALDELVKDVVVGGMADQRVNGNGFSQRGKIAHGYFLLAGRVEKTGWPNTSIVGQEGGYACAIDHSPGSCLAWRDERWLSLDDFCQAGVIP